VETAAQLDDVRSELKDRYGEPPTVVQNLLEYASLKLFAVKVGVASIERKREQVTIKFRQDANIDPEKLARFVSAQTGAHFAPDGTLKFPLKAAPAGAILTMLRDLLDELSTGAVVTSGTAP